MLTKTSANQRLKWTKPLSRMPLARFYEMKVQNYILFYVLVLLNLVRGQDSLFSALSFYPLNDGDYWEYRESFWEYPFYYDSSFYSIQVIGDTILSNKLKYKILERRKIPDNDQPYHFFERIDSSTANVYRYREHFDLPENEYLIDSLLAQVGDTSKSTRDDSDFSYRKTLCTNIDTVLILGKETIVKSYWDQSFVPGFQYDLALGFGYLGDYNCEFSCGSTRLLYAYINGTEYGNKVSSIREDEIKLTQSYQLYQNYPNPFNPNTIISFYLPVNSEVDVSLFDITGRFVERIVSKNYTQGNHSVEFNATNLASGQYLYILNTGKIRISKKLILIK
jgi:hypothetical protein